MLMPTLSVTLIGLIIGLTAGTARGIPGRGALRGLAAGWSGFIAGAFVGMILDALLSTGIWLALIGHAGAATAATLTFATRPRTPEAVGA